MGKPKGVQCVSLRCEQSNVGLMCLGHVIKKLLKLVKLKLTKLRVKEIHAFFRKPKVV